MAAPLDSAEVAAIDSGITRSARAQDDTLRMSCFGAPPATPAPGRAICILDGVRVSAIDGLQMLAIYELDVVRGAAATARYGADAANGAVVARINAAALERFKRLGVTATNVQSFMGRRVRPGLLSPNRVYVTVLMLNDARATQR
jgi:hypothetical protein